MYVTDGVAPIRKCVSMNAIRSDAIGGFNTFLTEQKKLDGEAHLTLVLFDHEYEVVFDAVPLAEVVSLDAETYVPRGTTALLDAVGRTIDTVGTRLAATPEPDRPGQVLFCILTDGLENASRDYTRDRVRSMIEDQQKRYGWMFQFLAANQDAFAEAGAMGIARSDAASFVADSAGVHAAFNDLSVRASVTRRREQPDDSAAK